MLIETIVTLLIGLIAGAVFTWWITKNRTSAVDLRPVQATLEADREMVLRELEQMRKATTLLDRALRHPVSRGRWGELALERVIQLAGMTEHVHYENQVTLPNSGQRPDIIIKLPNGRSVAVDAKVPLDAYSVAMEIEDDEARKAKLKEHAQQVRVHISELAKREYWRELPSPEFVVLHLPTEAIFRAALEYDMKLIEFGAQRGVLLTSPMSLIALLRAVAYGWSQEERAENVLQMAEMGRELFDLLTKLHDQWRATKESLRRAEGAFNSFTEAYRQVVEHAERFRALDSTIQAGKMEVSKLRISVNDYIPAEEHLVD